MSKLPGVSSRAVPGWRGIAQAWRQPSRSLTQSSSELPGSHCQASTTSTQALSSSRKILRPWPVAGSASQTSLVFWSRFICWITISVGPSAHSMRAT